MQRSLVLAALSAVALAVSPLARTADSVGEISLEIVTGESEARYRVQENVVGLPLSGAAVGVTGEIAGSILLGAEGQPLTGSEVRVDVGSLRSDQRRRDTYVRDEALQTARFPTVRFVPTELRGLPWPLPEAGTVHFEIAGELTVLELTRLTLWQAEATFAQDRVTLTVTSAASFGELGLTRPQVAFLLQVEDRITLEATLALRRDSELAP